MVESPRRPARRRGGRPSGMEAEGVKRLRERQDPVKLIELLAAAELAVWAVLHVVRHVPRIHVYEATEDGRR